MFQMIFAEQMALGWAGAGVKLPQPTCWRFCHQPCPAPEPPSCTHLAPIAPAPHLGGIKWHLPAQLRLLLLCLLWEKLVRKGLPLVVLKMQCYFFGLALRNSFDLLAEGSPRCLVLVEVAELHWSDEQPWVDLCSGEWWWPGGYPAVVTKICGSCSGKCKIVMNEVRVTNKSLLLMTCWGTAMVPKDQELQFCMFPQQVVLLGKLAFL